MDIKDLKPKSNTFITELTHPVSGDPLVQNKKNMWIERYLPHTKEYKTIKYEVTQKYLDAIQDGKPKGVNLMEMEEDTLEVLARTTKAWQVYYDGEWVDFSVEKAKELFEEAFWIQEQLQEKEKNNNLFT